MIRLGFIGAGAVIRHNHLPVLQKLSREVQIFGFASRRVKNAQAMAKLTGAPRVYENYHRLLADPDIDAVFTAVPIELNGKVLIDTVRAGKHVLAEKPLAATPQEGRRILKVCSKSRSIVAVAENFRYREDIIKAKQLIAKGAIGAPITFQVNVRFDLESKARSIWVTRPWRQSAHHPGGFVLDAGVHPVSGLRDLLGDVSEVFAHVFKQGRVVNGPDHLLMQVKMQSGVIGQCFFSYTIKEEKEVPLELVVFGERGTIRVTTGRLEWARRAGKPPRVYSFPQYDRGYPGQWKNFFAAIRGEEAVASTVEDAYRDLTVIDAALRSSQSGRKVRLT